MTKSICIVRLSALGDVLMLVPLVRTLQAFISDVKITWVISKPAYELVEGMDGVEFIVIPKPNNFMDYWQFKRQMQERYFDVLLATQASFRTNILYPLIRAKRKIGYDALRAKDGHRWFIKEGINPGKDHTLEGFLKFVEPLGILQKKITWDLPILEMDYVWARNHLPKTEAPLLVVNPAASKPERSWLIDRYIEIIQYAQARWQAQVVLTGGPGAYDRSLADLILKTVPVLDLVGKTRPKQLLAVIQLADALLCPDTGPSHMGAAVGTPVIALHAVTSSELSGPYIYRHLAVDCYPQALEVFLKKSFERNIWGTQVHGSKTMELVTVDAVKEKLEFVFSKFKSFKS